MRLPSDATLLIIGMETATGLPKDGAAKAAIAALAAVWRDADLPVVRVRDGPAELSSPPAVEEASEAFRSKAGSGTYDAMVTKAAVSAFTGTGLDALLTRSGRTTLVVCGLAAQGAVEATVRHAGELGYRVFVVKDACAETEECGGSGRALGADDIDALALARMSDADAVIVDAATAVAAALTAHRRRRRN